MKTQLVIAALALCAAQSMHAVDGLAVSEDELIYLGIQYGNTEYCKQLIKERASKKDCQNVNSYVFFPKKQTLLHCAVSLRRPEFCNLLVKAGADMNIFDKNDETPLTLAIVRNDIKCTKALLSTPTLKEYKDIKASRCGLIALRHAQPPLSRDIRLLIDQKLIDIFAQEHIHRIKEMLAKWPHEEMLSLARNLGYNDIAQFLDPATLEMSLLEYIKHEIRRILIPKPKLNLVAKRQKSDSNE